MGRRLLPHSLPDLYAHALCVERDAARRFAELERLMRDAGQDHLADEFEKIGNEEREQYEALAIGTSNRELPKPLDWEYAWHFLGKEVQVPPEPRNGREALAAALACERRAQAFYLDVAENALDDTVCAFAAEMAADEQRHVMRLELLLAREPEPARDEPEETVQP